MVESIQSSRSRLRLSTRWIVITGVIFAALLLTAALSFRRAPVQVRNARAYRETITSSIATNGKIEPIDNFEAHAPMATTIRRVNIRQGDRVTPGQLLLQLDDANARSEVARAQAQL